MNKTDEIMYSRNCPHCGKSILYSLPSNFYRARKNDSVCKSCSNTGKLPSEETRLKLSISHTGDRNPKYWSGKKRTPASEETKRKMSKAVKLNWKNPEYRKKYYDALSKTKYLKVRTDAGQMELLEKWNRMGFQFEPNYQVHTDTDLFYIDGYDPVHNVILEYDGKYHNRAPQKLKDNIRQQKITNILHPRKFWRYDAMNKSWRTINEL